ncbi:MAG: DMT family transporter [Candidatus Hodarchaeota archaeon]
MGKTKPVVFLLLAAFFWALPPVLGKLVIQDASPFFITTFRLLVSLLIFTPFLFRKDTKSKVRKLKKKTFFMLISSGAVFFGPHYILFFFGVQLSYATHVAILNQVGFVFSAIFCIYFLKESLTRLKLLGIGISIAGVFLVVWQSGAPPSHGLSPSGILIGDFLVLLGAVLWAIYSVFNKKYLDDVGNVPSIYLNFLFGMLIIVPFSIQEFSSIMSFDPFIIFILVLIAVFGSALGYYFYNAGIKDMEVSKASMICLTSPVWSIALSIISLGEPVTFFFILGTALVISSIFLVLREKKSDLLDVHEECISNPENLT